MATTSRLALLIIIATLGVQMPPPRPPGHPHTQGGKNPDIAKCPKCHHESDIKRRKGFYCETCDEYFTPSS